MEQRRGDAVAVGGDARETAVEIAELEIGEREPLGRTRRIVDEAQAGVDAVELALGIIHAAIAPVGKAAQARLDPAVRARVEAQTQAEPALLIGRGAVDRAALALHDRNETVAAAVAAVDGDLSAPDLAANRCRRIPTVTATISKARRRAVGQFRIEPDRSGERARSIGAAAATPRDDDAAKVDRIIGAPRDPAAKWVGLRDAIERHQRAARCIATKAAERDALTRRMRAAPVGAAELDDTSFVAQAVFDTGAEAGVEVVDQRDALHRVAMDGRKPTTPGNDDDVLQRKIMIGTVRVAGLRHCRRRQRQRRRPHQKSDHAGLTASGCAL